MASASPHPPCFDLRSPTIMASKEAPSCVQKAMVLKDRKPFTYTPGGLDLSEIKSEKMAKRLMRNAMCPGVPETPKTPPVTVNGPSMKTPANYYNMPVAVFPMIQIPQNPKELLRRTSGPNRRDSFESDILSPKIEEKQTPKLEEIFDKDNKSENVDENNGDVKLELKENIPVQTNDIQVKKTSIKPNKTKERSSLKLKKKISPKVEKSIESSNIKAKEELEICKVDLIVSETKIDLKKEDNSQYIKGTIEIATIPATLSIQSVHVDTKREEKDSLLKSDNSDTVEFPKQTTFLTEKVREVNHTVKEDTNNEINEVDESITNFKAKNISLCENIDEDNSNDYYNKEQENEGDVTPKIDVITHQFEQPKLYKLMTTTSKDSQKSELIFPINNTNGDEKNKLPEIILYNEKSFEPFRRENSNQIVSRRKSENIKSLNNDLDNLPSLNLCSKRFSFLRESPPKDDPFSILTGIPAKIALVDKNKKKAFQDINEDNIFKKSDENIPKYDAYDSMSSTKSLYDDLCNVSNNYIDKMNGLSDNEAKNTTNTYVSPKLFNDFSCTKEDNVPAWKKELIEIANQKKETNEECEYYKEAVEPPWRRELREMAQSRIQRESAPSYNVWNKLVKAVETNTNEESPVLSNPIWSHTLKPKSWKERKADLSREKDIEVPEWKNAVNMRKNFMNSIINKSTSSSSSCSSPGREVRKTPEILIEITGQPLPAQEQRQTVNNGYTYPWESSSESSTTFSPEPYAYERTPTPQSRSSPYNSIQSGMQSPVIAREFGNNYQANKRYQRRSCPFQSRSFKYLQMLTGTSDGFEDDEPFIPQSPQHAHLRPDNV